MKLTLNLNNQRTFFGTLEIGSVFTYSDAFIPQEIIKLALEKNISVEYCVPGTSEDIEFGSYTMKVIDITDTTTIDAIDTLVNRLSDKDKWKVLEEIGKYLNVEYFG